MNSPIEAIADVNTGIAQADIEALFLAHYGRVARLIGRVVRDRGRSEELAVEVFLKLWRNQKAQSENVEGWLYRVAVRVAVDELRRRARREHYEHLLAWVRPKPEPRTPEAIHFSGEEQERVRRVLGQLGSRQAQFLLLRSQDFTYDEMATILSVSQASIGTLLGRAQKSFRKEYIKRYGHE